MTANIDKPWIERGHHALWIVGLLWLECVVVWMIQYWGAFDPLAFRDPDDAMRLVQVRDFLAGQNWFDVSQHRVNPPLGGPMHWSRLVDMPIAGIILLVRPIVGVHWAEVIACITVPIMTFGLICLSYFWAMRRFLGTGLAVFTIALLATSFPILVQTPPLRIDHHAWQILMAAIVSGGIIHPNQRKGGLIAGIAMALWLHISSEGLPTAALVGGILALRYGLRKTEWQRLIGYFGILVAGSLALLLLTRGVQASLVAHCDSMSPVYILTLVAMVPALLIGRMLCGSATFLRRCIPFALALTAAGATYYTVGGICLAGPFATMDPLVYRVWLSSVMEGQPIWRQDAMTATVILAVSLTGILCMAWAWWCEDQADRRMNWLSLLLLAGGGLLTAMMVLRSMGTAHLFALPGIAWGIAKLYQRVRAFTSMPARVLCTLLLCIPSPAGLAVMAAQFTGDTAKDDAAETPKNKGGQELARLSVLPRSVIFASLDVGPDILLRTQHSVIGTGHHRNIAGISLVLRGFLAPPDKAREIVLSTPASYLIFTPEQGEAKRYINTSKTSLMAQLMAGHPPAWLVPVKIEGLSFARVYRVVRPENQPTVTPPQKP